MKEFTIEMDGKEILAKFKDPTFSFKSAWMSYLAQKKKESKNLGGEKAIEDDPEIGLRLMNDLEHKRNSFLIELCTNGVIKSPEDFHRISIISINSMYQWLDDCLVVKTKEGDKNFTKA